jgi:hypothetical protein
LKLYLSRSTEGERSAIMPVNSQRKEAIRENDLLLVYVDHKPGFFARVEEILPDVKPSWWRIRLLPLGLDNLDYKTMVWILDEEQIRGAEYTMSGIPMRLEKIPPYRPSPPEPSEEKETASTKVISIADRRKGA